MSRVPKDLIRASAAERRESRCEAVRLFQINAGLLCFAPLRNFFPKSFPFDFTAASANPFVQLTGHSARRCYEKFMRKEMWGVSYFYALEQNSCRDGFHVHALWCDCKNKSRRDIWRNWFGRYGRARIEPVNSRDDVADYCAKYVTKEGAWWNVKLLSHRHPKTSNNFALVNE